MIHRSVLFFLVFCLPLLLVAFSVCMAAYLLLDATGDTAGASALRWIAIAVLLLTVVDFVMLVGALGINSLGNDERPTGRPPE